MAGPGDHDRYRRIDAAFRDGDLDALRAELEEIDGFPNVVAHPAMGRCLTYAIYHSPLSLVRALLDAGADPDADDGDGFPPLIAALTTAAPAPGTVTRHDVPAVVTLLLERGADVHRRGLNDWTALHVAAGQGDLHVVDLLLAHGADPNAITRIDDMETPLETAERAGHRAVADRLRPLTTRLDWERACRSGDVRALERMIQAGHDVNARDGYGQTALMRAAHAGQRGVVELLLGRGAELDCASKFNLTALMLAVVAGHSGIARLLARAGADLGIEGTGAPGFDGKTAADLADARGDTELADALRARPARGDRT